MIILHDCIAQRMDVCRIATIRNSFDQVLYDYVYLLPWAKPRTIYFDTLNIPTYPTSNAATRYIQLTKFQYSNVSPFIVDSVTSTAALIALLA